MENKHEKRALEDNGDEVKESKRLKTDSSEPVANTENTSETQRLEINLQKEYTCSISHKLFASPVDTPCNHTFEEEQIRLWIKKAIQTNNSNQFNDNHEAFENADCPLCRGKISYDSLKPNEAMKKKVDQFIQEHPTKIFLRYCEVTKNNALVKAIKEKNTQNILEILKDNWHLLFAGNLDKYTYRSTLCYQNYSLEILKTCVDFLKQYPTFLSLFLGPDNLKTNAIHYVARGGDIDKLRYLMEELNLDNLDTLLYAKSVTNENILHSAAFSKNFVAFEYLLNKIKQENKKSMLLEFTQDSNNFYSNVFTTACRSDSPEMVKTVLSFFEDETDKNIICNQLFYIKNHDIFAVMAMCRNNSMAITELADNFLEKKLSTAEIKRFKSIAKKNKQTGDNEKISLFILKNSKVLIDMFCKKLDKLEKVIKENSNIHEEPHIHMISVRIMANLSEVPRSPNPTNNTPAQTDVDEARTTASQSTSTSQNTDTSKEGENSESSMRNSM